MQDIQDLLDGYKKFHKKYFTDDSKIYQELVSGGQTPKFLVISCSDSRVPPSLLFDEQPGDIFSLRNVANLVPPFEDDKQHYHGTSSAIEFAVVKLKVKHIIVLGHSDCGGIKELMNEIPSSDESFMDHWIKLAAPARARAMAEASDPHQACCLCEKYAILNSLENLLTFPFIRARVDAGKLTLHGWYFNLGTGTLEKL